MTEMSATVGTLVVKILADSTDLQKGVKESKKSLQEISSESKKTSKSMEELDRSASKSGKSLSDSADDADDYSDSLKGASSAADKTSGNVDDLTASLKQEGDAADKAGDKVEDAGEKTEDLGDAASGTAGKSKSLKSQLGDLKIAGFGVVAGLMAAAAAMISVANAAQEAEKKVEAAYKTIRVGAGATGEELAKHMEVFESLNSTVSNSEDEVAKAVSNLNAYYDIQGDELEKLAKKYLDLANLTNTDVVTIIEEAHDAFNKWGVSVDEQADKLDYFFKVCKNPEKNMGAFLQTLSEADNDFKLLGYSIDDAAAIVSNAIQTKGLSEFTQLTGAMELGLSSIMSSQKEAVATAQSAYEEALEEYKDLSDEYWRLVDAGAPEEALEAASQKVNAAEKALSEANRNWQDTLKSTSTADAEKELMRVIDAMKAVGDEAQAQKLGEDIFGEKRALAVAKALYSGALGFEELKTQAEETAVTLADVVEETQTTDEKMTLMGKHINDRLEPMGSKLTDMLLTAEPAIIAVADAIAWVNTKCELFLGKLTTILEKIGILNAGEGIGEKFLGFFVTFCEMVTGVVSMALDGLIIGLDLLAGNSESAMERFNGSFSDAFLSVTDGAFGFMKTVSQIIESGLNLIVQFVEDALNSLLRFVTDIANGIIDVFTNAVNLAIDAVNTLIDSWNTVASITGGPMLSRIASISIEHIQAPKVEMSEITALTDALNQQYEALAKAVADRKGETTNNYNITINAKDKESGTNIANKTSRAFNRSHAGGSGI